MRTIRTQRFVRGQGSAESGSIGLAPFISEVRRARMPRNTIHRVEIIGYYFTKASEVIITGGNPNARTGTRSNANSRIRVLDKTFVNPTKLEVNIISGSTEGTFTVIVINGTLDSGTTGKDILEVIDPVWVDFRQTDIDLSSIEITNGFTIEQDSEKGLITNGINTFKSGVKFLEHSWRRKDELEFNIVFSKKGNGNGFFGIGSSEINVNTLGEFARHEAETQMFLVLNSTSQCYGGGSELSRWFQDIGKVVLFTDGIFYKIKFHQSGDIKTLMSLYEVDSLDFDNELQLLHQWSSNCPANNEILMPYWSSIGNFDVFLAGFKVG